MFLAAILASLQLTWLGKAGLGWLERKEYRRAHLGWDLAGQEPAERSMATQTSPWGGTVGQKE